jgi:hypothetical protein
MRECRKTGNAGSSMRECRKTINPSVTTSEFEKGTAGLKHSSTSSGINVVWVAVSNE